MIELQKTQQELQLKQEALQKFDRESQESAAVKRDELLKPILTKVQDAIKAVAKANGYLMVFDVSGGFMLFAAESDDLTPLIKKQLGIQ
jgi:outer membrane protein